MSKNMWSDVEKRSSIINKMKEVMQSQEYKDKLAQGIKEYYSENMSEFSCPVVGPDYISQECKDIQGLNCKQINC